MENLYQILQCEDMADYSDLKKAYFELALRYHPDKTGQHSKTSAETFSKISKAWRILSDPQLRKEYDIRWKERCLAQTYPIQDTVSFEDFETVDDQEMADCTESEESSKCYDDGDLTAVSSDYQMSDSSCFAFDCRCGGRYVLTGTDVEMKFDIVCCDSCSLTIQVLYNDKDTVS